jgi:hypothetical protein
MGAPHVIHHRSPVEPEPPPPEVLEPEVVDVDVVEPLEPEVLAMLEVDPAASGSLPMTVAPLQPSFVATTSPTAPAKGMYPNESIIDWRTMKPPRAECA